MADVQATIRAMEERLWNAQLSGDVGALDHLIADDLLFTGLSGSLETKAGDLEQHRSGALKITKLDPLDHDHLVTRWPGCANMCAHRAEWNGVARLGTLGQTRPITFG